MFCNRLYKPMFTKWTICLMDIILRGIISKKWNAVLVLIPQKEGKVKGQIWVRKALTTENLR